MHNKKVSVVMATYNGEKYIKAQLDSLYNQTYTDYELIILDDCSKDNTVKIIKEYIQKRELSDWRIFMNEENIGWRKNFIEGLKRARGEYIFFADQDDIWIKDKIEKIVKTMEANKKIEVLAHNYDNFFEEGYCVTDNYAFRKYGKKKICHIKAKKYINHVIRPGCCMCIRRNILEDVIHVWCGGCAHDSFFWRMGMMRKSLYIYNETLILHRRHSAANTPESIRYTKERAKGMLPYIELYKRAENEKIYVDSRLLSESKKYLQYRVELINNKRVLSLDTIKYLKYYPKLLSFVADLFSH